MLGRVNDLDIRLLRVFVKIVECGGFKQAQVALNISASQISGHMNDLETRLGFRLCERGRSGFRVTPQGEVVYQEAVKLLEHLESFRSIAVEQTGRLSGDFRIGFQDNIISSPGNYIPEAIHRFSQHEHDVRLCIEVLPPVDLENRVLDGTLDLGFGFFYHEVAGISYEAFLTERHHLYCGRRHPLFHLSEDELTLEEIEKYSLSNRGFYDMEERAIQHGPVVPKFESNDNAYAVNPEAMLSLVVSGFCLAYIPTHYAKSFEDQGVVRPIWPDRIHQFGPCAMIQKSGDNKSLVHKTFLQALEESRKAHTEPAALA